MSDNPETPPIETAPTESPLQRALRLKTAAAKAKATDQKGAHAVRERAAAARSSAKSKPWMSR